MAGKTVDTIQLELDELLERSHTNNSVLKLENICLDVNLMLHLLNRYSIYYSSIYILLIPCFQIFLEKGEVDRPYCKAVILNKKNIVNKQISLGGEKIL